MNYVRTGHNKTKVFGAFSDYCDIKEFHKKELHRLSLKSNSFE